MGLFLFKEKLLSEQDGRLINETTGAVKENR